MKQRKLLVILIASASLAVFYVLSYAPVYLNFTYDVFGIPKQLWDPIKVFYAPVHWIQSNTFLHDPLFAWWSLWCDFYLSPVFVS